MDDVVNTGVGLSSVLDGIASYKDGGEFEFGRNDESKGILKKPSSPLFKVQFGDNSMSNPFVKKPMIFSNKAWNTSGINGFGSSLLSNQYTADVDRFAEKLKQGSEELALKMEYTPNAVSKQGNGNKRIQFSAEEVYKGGQACFLQLYGYFVGTSMDYRVFMGLKRLLRPGIFYFKFKSEEGMKNVLESGPWMIQNVPLVLNTWEP
ncbi:RNA-directed DNA polymerase, eukaryota, reverse transcriptase zinc-binding domain protein, partial [Tanacetum coccineum]